MFGCNSIKEVYFGTATNRRLPGASWSIIAPPFISAQLISAMMKQPDWIGRIPQIRAELSCVTTQFIDRRQLERLFGVSASQGRRLITRMGPMLHGNSLGVCARPASTADLKSSTSGWKSWNAASGAGMSSMLPVNAPKAPVGPGDAVDLRAGSLAADGGHDKDGLDVLIP